MKTIITNIISSVKDSFKRLLSSLRNFFFGQKEESVITEPTTRKSPESVQKGRGGKEGSTWTLSSDQKSSHSFIMSEEEKEYLRLVQTGSTHHNYGREVIQYNKETFEEIKRFKNTNIASKETGIDPASIRRSCNLIVSTAGGYIWMYA